MKTSNYLIYLFVLCLSANSITFGQNQKRPLTRAATNSTSIFLAMPAPDQTGTLYRLIGPSVEYENHNYLLSKKLNHLFYLNINQATITPGNIYELKLLIVMSGIYTKVGNLKFIATQDKYTPTYNENIPLILLMNTMDVPSVGLGVLLIELFDSSGNKIDWYQLSVKIN